MTETKNFGDVSWAEYAPRPGAGWRMPSDPSRYISVDDPYWGRVLDSARKAYGDPNIHFDTGQPSSRYDSIGDVAQPRHLVFGDGTRLPADGTVVYHDAVTKHDWAQNKDGTASLMGPDGHPGPPVAPAGYRKIGDQYAPVNVNGQQIAPQLGGVPNSENGFHTDPKTGVLTPKNGNGDYYTLGPDGKKHFFDKANAPITEEQYNSAQHRDPATPAPDEGLSTDEQQSGHAADAVKKLQAELKQRFTTISGAEEKLSEVLLTAHATTTAGQAKLNEIQKNIVAAVNNPAMDTTTAAGEKAYLTFLRSQVSAIRDLLASSSLNAEDQSKAAQALAALYAADNASTTNPPASPEITEPASPAPEQPGLTSPDLGGGGFTDPGLGPVTPMPDPYLSDVMGGMPGSNPLGADPMSALASMLPGALGSLGGAASPLEGLGGLASPLAGLGAGLGSQAAPHAADAVDKVEEKPEPSKQEKPGAGSEDKVEPAKAETKSPVPGSQPDEQSNGQPGSPPAPVAAPAPASPVVNLPDGSTSNARTPGSAQAVRDYLAGGTIDAAYRQNGMTLPPVGTPVTNPVDPTRLTCGDVAMFKDHYEPVLSSVKGYLNGQVVPLGQVISSPDFLGFIDPTALAAATGPAATAPPAGVPAQPAPVATPSPLTAPMAGVPAPAGLPSG